MSNIQTQTQIFRLESALVKADDEINTLRAQVERLRSGYQGACYACEPVGELNLKLTAEVERLNEANRLAMDHLNEQRATIRLLRSEIERKDKALTDITIPAKTENAVAKELLNQFLYLYIKKDGDPYDWNHLPKKAKDDLRDKARAACLAMLKAWPEMTFRYHPNDPTKLPAIILPITEKINDKG